MSALLDQYGRPLGRPTMTANEKIVQLQQQINKVMRAKYDASQTSINNQQHWLNADNLDPHSSNSFMVRRRLRSRSRYEVIENNPYLHGVILSLANDFVRSGPKLKITDKRITPKKQRKIEQRFQEWCQEIKLAHKLWQMRIAKITDGESFLIAFSKPRQDDPIKLNFKVVESERISTPEKPEGGVVGKYKEIDGVRFDENDEPIAYHLLNYHPGGNLLFDALAMQKLGGRWIDQRYVVHWFRQTRPWLRGIPEITPSLPLCALLRRYTLSVVRAAEVGADFSAVLETEGPPNIQQWTDSNGNLIDDDPFDIFPIEMGMFTVLPWKTKMKQFDAKQPMQVYDMFVNALLREILRPLMTPFNVGVGSSKESNMASAVVDGDIYKSGQEFERFNANDFVMDHIFSLWWSEATLVSNLFSIPDESEMGPSIRMKPPKHYWRWDKIGIDHTDPQKVANAMQTLFDGGHITDRDIQERYFNRDVDDWRDELEENIKWRKSLDLTGLGQLADPNEGQQTRKSDRSSSSSKKPAKKANNK